MHRQLLISRPRSRHLRDESSDLRRERTLTCRSQCIGGGGPPVYDGTARLEEACLARTRPKRAALQLTSDPFEAPNEMRGGTPSSGAINRILQWRASLATLGPGRCVRGDTLRT